MDGYRPEAWHDLAVASVGASAALTGLLFVAVSINLNRILQYAWLPRRAAVTLILLLALLATGLFVLIPGQPLPALAGELAGTGIVLAVPATFELVRGPTGEDTKPYWRIVPAILLYLPALTLFTTAATLLAGTGGGLYWLPAVLVGGTAGACWNAWVLLVEIQR